jgi:3-oxoacyl-[acyl-carrier protein] reductase
LGQGGGRVALVTDGSGGIGAVTVRRLAEAGWDVAFSYRGDSKPAREVEKAASELGVRVLATPADPAGPASWIQDAEEELGPARAMVICAGITRDRPAALTPEADWRAVIETGLDGTGHLSRAAAAAMSRRRSGVIVVVSSVCGVYDHAGSRPGTAALIRVLAGQAGRFGVRVNAVVPGRDEPDLTAIVPGGARLTETVALRRFGHAAEIADLVMFLLSEEASALTGRVFPVTSIIQSPFRDLSG